MARSALSNLSRNIGGLVVVVGLMMVASDCCLGQTAAGSATEPAEGAPYVPTMTFDVASVRENKNVDMNEGYAMSGRFTPHTTMLRMVNWRIANVISVAYGVNEGQIANGPNWPSPALFVIEAKGGGDAEAKIAKLAPAEQLAEQRHMLQVLLEERFKLKAHWETREGDIYQLVVAKGGPKLGAEGSRPPSVEELKNFGDHPVLPLYQKNDGQGYDFIAHGCSMEKWAEMLAQMFGRPVIDETGLRGKYDFVLKYRGRWDRDRAVDDTDPTPPMDRALQEQLGLKTEPAKGPVRVLVIDHIEKPTEN